VLVLRAPGTNCDQETARAWELAGAEVETWHMGRLLEDPHLLGRFGALTLPGGFSYGDDLGAGRILATRLATVLGDALRGLLDRGGLVLGICNGFQVLVKAGLLPGTPALGPCTLTFNASGRFESRWVRLKPEPGRSPFLEGDEPFELPVAHGEGRLVTSDPRDLAVLEAAGQVVLRYADASGRPTQAYPANPNGSVGALAGLCDPTGQVFALMPHPERFVEPFHHPRWTREGLHAEGDGLRIFRNAVKAMTG
jgi:phosphoribosylformylglycinamidine synthase